MTDLAYVDVRAVLAKVADLERDLVLVGDQAVNFCASFYEPRVPELARGAPFTSKDIDFCGDPRAVRVCAERLGGTPRIATFDDATPNSGASWPGAYGWLLQRPVAKPKAAHERRAFPAGEPKEPLWKAYDYNTAIELGYCCAATPQGSIPALRTRVDLRRAARAACPSSPGGRAPRRAGCRLSCAARQSRTRPSG